MSVFTEIKNLKTGKLASEMPDSFTAKVVSGSKHQNEYGSSLRLALQTKDGEQFSVSYRIPKALTGKGQMDRLLNSLERLGISIEEIEGKTFVWKRMQLTGSMKGNPRHYPIQFVE